MQVGNGVCGGENLQEVRKKEVKRFWGPVEAHSGIVQRQKRGDIYPLG